MRIWWHLHKRRAVEQLMPEQLFKFWSVEAHLYPPGDWAFGMRGKRGCYLCGSGVHSVDILRLALLWRPCSH